MLPAVEEPGGDEREDAGQAEAREAPGGARRQDRPRRLRQAPGPVEQDGQRAQRPEPHAGGQEVHGVDRDRGTGKLLGRRGVAGGPDDRQTERAQPAGLEAKGEPVPHVALLVGQEEQPAGEDEQGLAGQPHGAVLRRQQDRPQGRRREARPQARPGGHRGLAPEIEQRAGDRDRQSPPTEGEEAAVQPFEQRDRVGAGGLRRRPGHEHEEREHADEKAGAEELGPANGDGERFHHLGIWGNLELFGRLQREPVVTLRAVTVHGEHAPGDRVDASGEGRQPDLQ